MSRFYGGSHPRRAVRSSQRGMSFLYFLVMLAVWGGLGRLAFQLAPLYFNNMRLVASLEGLKAQPEWYTWSREDILDALRKRWAIDPVDHVTAQAVRVERDLGKTRVRVTYDVVQPFFRNVELLVHFDEAIEEIRH